MTEAEFWELMTFADIEAARAEDEEKAVDGIIDVLKRTPPEAINSFYEHLAKALYALDTSKQAAALQMDSFISDALQSQLEKTTTTTG